MTVVNSFRIIRKGRLYYAFEPGNFKSHQTANATVDISQEKMFHSWAIFIPADRHDIQYVCKSCKRKYCINSTYVDSNDKKLLMMIHYIFWRFKITLDKQIDDNLSHRDRFYKIIKTIWYLTKYRNIRF